MKIEIEQYVFPYKVMHAYAVISFIHYYHVIHLLPLQVEHARNSLLLCKKFFVATHNFIILRTPQIRVKRLGTTLNLDHKGKLLYKVVS